MKSFIAILGLAVLMCLFVDTTESRRMTYPLYRMPSGHLYDEAENVYYKRCANKGEACNTSSDCCYQEAICSSATGKKECFMG